ncbi:MAG: hypothetical protein JNN07_12335 [Verrucomicrobiales bacterium]|nr:hypothetical protein [Verrucomicrobiales bacterium]
MSAPPVIPDHTLRRPIGRGAYGEVWLARNIMGAPRAVKIVWRRHFESDRPYEREFAGIQRYEPVSRSAEGLVHVLHVGRNNAEGYFYYVMELADSAVPMPDLNGPLVGAAGSAELTPLAEYAPRTLRSDIKLLGRLPIADCLRVALDAVGGLARLHQRGLVHRDVKPGNIIFVDGHAKLADIGLVSRESEGRTFVGTEGYIPPEGPGQPTADLYALGMALYEAATGFPPERFPKAPKEWFAETAPPELLEFHAVVLRSCEGSKARRYQSADEMQADLALLQSGQSVRRLRALEERVARWRSVGWAAGISVVLASMFAFVGHWRVKVLEETQARETQLLDDARHSQARAENAERESRHQLYSALLEQARANVRSGEMGQRVRALDAVRRAAAISNSAELRREAMAALALPDLRLDREMKFPSETSLIQLDATFERIALGRQRGPVEIRSLKEDRLLATLPASTNLICFSALWSADGRYIALNRDHDTAGYRSDIEVWDLASTPRRVVLFRDARWKARAFHPGLPRFLAGGPDGLMVAWDLETGKELARARFDATPQELAYSPDGTRTAATYQRTDGWGASVHEATGGAMICSRVFKSQIRSFAWHPSGRWLALSETGGTIYLMDSSTGEIQALGRHKAEAVSTTFEAKGRYLITGAWGRELICWDIKRKQRAFAIDVDGFIAQFRKDGQACAFTDHSRLQICTFERPGSHSELAEEMAPQTRNAAFSPEGRWLSASSAERLGVWDLRNEGPGAFVSDGADSRMYWGNDGMLFGSNSGDAKCFQWQVRSATNDSSPPTLEPLLLRRPSGLGSLFVRSNAVAWTTARGSQIRLRPQLPPEEEDWKPTIQGINGISPDHRWLAIYGAYTRHLSVYQLPELQLVARLTNLARISGFSFSPGCDQLAVASTGQVEFWNTQSWNRVRLATGFIGLPVAGVLYQPDGRALWMARSSRIAGLHAADDLRSLLPLPKGLYPLAQTEDGGRLAVSVDGRRIQIWDLQVLRSELAELGLGW